MTDESSGRDDFEYSADDAPNLRAAFDAAQRIQYRAADLSAYTRKLEEKIARQRAMLCQLEAERDAAVATIKHEARAQGMLGHVITQERLLDALERIRSIVAAGSEGATE